MTATPPPTEPATPAQPGQPTGSGQPPASSSGSSVREGVDRATALTDEFIDRGAPWSSNTSWTIVLAEGIVAGILGLLFLFKPLGGSATTLQLTGLALLLGALLNSFQLWRGRIRPDLRELLAFRAGSGVTVGLVVVMATFFAAVTDSVSAALAVVVGVGFIVFGLAGIAASFVRRTNDMPLPLAGLILNAVFALSGLVLMFAGAAGADAVDNVYNLLGIALVAAGLVLAGYAYLIRQQETQGVRR